MEEKVYNPINIERIPTIEFPKPTVKDFTVGIIKGWLQGTVATLLVYIVCVFGLVMYSKVKEKSK